MIQALCVEGDPEGFRRAMEEADFLEPGAPIAHRAGRGAHVAVLRIRSASAGRGP